MLHIATLTSLLNKDFYTPAKWIVYCFCPVRPSLWVLIYRTPKPGGGGLGVYKSGPRRKDGQDENNIQSTLQVYKILYWGGMSKYMEHQISEWEVASHPYCSEGMYGNGLAILFSLVQEFSKIYPWKYVWVKSLLKKFHNQILILKFPAPSGSVGKILNRQYFILV